MDMKILIRAGLRRQRGTIVGVALLMAMVTLSTITALAMLINADRYVSGEMARLGYGDTTYWVSGAWEPSNLTEVLEELPEVDVTQAQPVIFSGYRIGDKHSDDEGQLIPYNPDRYAYRFLSDFDGEIEPGTAWLSPAMRSSFDVEIGDEVRFELSRDGSSATFTVAGWFEDPFMGSAMIDKKGFLISQSDWEAVADTIREGSSFNALAREGAMLHIFRARDLQMSEIDFNRALNGGTDLPKYTEFSYSRQSIFSFMLLLQHILTGFLCAFGAVLLVIAMIVTGHSLSAGIEQETPDIGILKTMGLTSAALRRVQLVQYGAGILAGMLAGLAGSAFASRGAARMMLTSNGLQIPGNMPLLAVLSAFTAIFIVFLAFVSLRTRRILEVSPMMAISGRVSRVGGRARSVLSLKRLSLSLALREVLSHPRRYLGTLAIALLLTFFVGTVTRMNLWLGPKGEGLMDAFSVAEHDIGIEPTRDMDMDAAREIISRYGDITGSYDLAMQPVTLNGTQYTVNVISDTRWLHILEGAACGEGEIVITRTVAADQDLSIGDAVTLVSRGNSASYTVSGIYQCANGMGANLGMSLEGYARVADVHGYIWCHHFVLTGDSDNEALMAQLQAEFRVEANVHTNSWSGLDGIVGALHLLTVFMGVIVALFILVVVALTGSRLLLAEKRDMAISKALGFTSARIRGAFALRFALVSVFGAILGTILCLLLSDGLIGRMLRLFGIGSFTVQTGWPGVLLPGGFVLAAFVLSSWLWSRRIRTLAVAELIRD